MASNIKRRFLNKIQVLTASKRNNCTSIHESQYKDIVLRLNELQKGAKKCPTDYSLISRYQLSEISQDGEITQILVKRETNLQIVTIEDLFDVIKDTHLSTGHGGRDILQNQINKKYSNVTRQQIMVFLEMCETCQLKKCQVRKSLVVKPILSNELNSRCQVDLIDMQSQPDGKFRFILDYQDHLTKIVRLRALETKTAKEVAHHLVEIFCELGAPLILQSDNGREFANQVVKEVLSYWPECRLIHGKPRHSQSQGSVERANRDVQAILACWQKENNTNKWSDGLKFVQWQKNTRLHSGIGTSPYQAMFGCEPRLGMASVQLPKVMIAAVETEEEFVKVFGSEIDEEPEQNSSSDLLNTCVSCDQACSGAHHCKDCGLICHAISPCSIPDSHANESEGFGSVVICRNCSHQQAIKCVRQGAKKRQHIQATKMLENSAKRLKPAVVGDTVMIPVPAVDRGRAEFRNVKAVVFSVEGTGLYKLGSRHGLLKQLYSRNQFSVCSEKFLSLEEVKADNEVSLREIARKDSMGDGQGYFMCKCAKSCETARCKCIKANVLCNSHCHNSQSCGNK